LKSGVQVFEKGEITKYPTVHVKFGLNQDLQILHF